MPAQSTYTPIATASPNNATVDFTNIPATYTDLVLVVYGRGAGAFSTAWDLVVLNADSSGSSYSRTVLTGNGSSVSAFRETNYAQLYTTDGFMGASSTANVFCPAVFHIMNYANTNVFKTVIGNSSTDLSGSGQSTIMSGVWRSTAAVNRLQLFVASGTNTFANGSMATLYGITAA